MSVDDVTRMLEELAARPRTNGHDPDDERRATVGGWLAGLYGHFEAGWLSISHQEHPGGPIVTDWCEVTDLDRAAGVVVERSRSADVWVGVATRHGRLGSGSRGGDDDCAQFPALWADVDVQGPAHAADDLPPSFAAARELIAAFPLPPTAVVNTGHGLQPWWCLAEPVDIEAIGPALDRWEATWVRLAGQRGSSVDHVWDLARMLRVPGSFNRKAEIVPVAVEAVDWSRRYGLDDLDSYLDDPPAPPEPRSSAPATDGLRPGDLWAAEHPWADILTADGATFLGMANSRHGPYERWSRPSLPGEQFTPHLSATVDYGGSDVLKVFSSNWAPLSEGQTYSRFGYHAATRYGGDHSAAAADLASKGYKLSVFDLVGRSNGASDEDAGTDDDNEAPSDDALPFGAVTLTKFCDGAGGEPTYDWLVPELIERGDRVVVTGDEGKGKSTLLRQLALGAAAGVNTLARGLLDREHEPRTVLLVDCENPRAQLRREFPKAWRALPEDARRAVTDRLTVVLRADGLVLDDPADRLGDRAGLTTLVEAVNPDLVLIGPVYKLMAGDPSAEPDTRNLANYLGRLRGAEAHRALVIEAHAPHADKRPYGWSGWKRWPEFGFHLLADGTLRPFRGGRDDARAWPIALRRGSETDWPWQRTEQPEGAPADAEADRDATARQRTLRVLHELAGLDPGRGWTTAELCDRVVGTTTGAAAQRVRQAVLHFADRGWLIVESQERRKGALTHTVETYRLDPNGPAK